MALTWKPPVLKNAVTIDVTDANRSLSLDPAKDYLLRHLVPITKVGGLTITGGHNVVSMGAEVHFSEWLGADHGKANRALYIKNFTGTFHLEGMHAGGLLGEGIDVDTRTPGAVLQVQNTRIELVQGTQTTNHADLIQNWGGPLVYRIDGLTGSTTYQGLFLQSSEYGEETELCDFRRMNLRGSGAYGRYLIYRTGSSAKKIVLTDVWCQPGTNWAKESGGYPAADATWKTIKHGTPPAGDFVPLGACGLGYKSPGYA